jgi:hypothetical protein
MREKRKAKKAGKNERKKELETEGVTEREMKSLN